MRRGRVAEIRKGRQEGGQQVRIWKRRRPKGETRRVRESI